VADFVFGSPLGAAGGSVATSNDGCGLTSSCHNSVHQLLRAVGKVLELEDAGRTAKNVKEAKLEVGHFRTMSHSIIEKVTNKKLNYKKFLPVPNNDLGPVDGGDKVFNGLRSDVKTHPSVGNSFFDGGLANFGVGREF